MRRRLILMRHAKSSWHSDAPTDHARPLAPRGRRDAPRVGHRLVELDWSPELVLSSDSARTRETWALVAEELLVAPQVRFLAALYHGGAEALGAALAEVPPGVRTVLALGHNPGWEELATRLANEPVTLKTACAALLEAEHDTWAAALDAPWTLRALIRAKDLA